MSTNLEVLRIFRYSRNVSYSEVASVVVLTWDITLLISDEIDLIWRRNWTPAKGMYIFSRYVPWIAQVALLAINVDGSTGLRYTVTQCKQWMIMQAVMLQLSILAVDVTLMIRVHTLYNRNRHLLYSLSTLFLAELTFLSYVLVEVTPKLTFDNECFVNTAPTLFIAYWITSLGFETILFLLTMVKFVNSLREGWGRRPVIRSFFTDGTWAYVLIFVTMLLNTMLYAFTKGNPVAGICFTWLLTVLSFAGSRLVLMPRLRSESQSSLGQELSVGQVHIPLSPISPRYPVSPVKNSFLDERTEWPMYSANSEVPCFENAALADDTQSLNA